MRKGSKQFNKNTFWVNLLCFLPFFLLLSSCSFKTFITKNKTVEYSSYYRFKGTKLRLKETITLFQDSTFNVNREGLNLGNIELIESKGFYEQNNRFLILTCSESDYYSNKRFFILNRNTLIKKVNGKCYYFKKVKQLTP